jgi:hypothetical protein
MNLIIKVKVVYMMVDIESVIITGSTASNQKITIVWIRISIFNLETSRSNCNLDTRNAYHARS